MEQHTRRVAIGFFLVALACRLSRADGGSSRLCLGDSSLVGVARIDSDDETRCCDLRGRCHGYDSRRVRALLRPGALDVLPKAEKHRSKRSEESGKVFVEDPLPQPATETVCCQSNMSVLFPVSGISVTSGERVPVLQIAPFRQSVVYNRCLEKECRILRGYCSQVYLPQQVYVLTVNSTTGKAAAERDLVWVEAGCQCQTGWHEQAHPSLPSIGVDEKLSHFFQLYDQLDELGDLGDLGDLVENVASVDVEMVVDTAVDDPVTPSSPSSSPSSSPPPPERPSPLRLPPPGHPLSVQGFHDPVMAVVQKFSGPTDGN